MNTFQCYFSNIYIFFLSIIGLIGLYLVGVSLEQGVLKNSYTYSVQVYKKDIQNYTQDSKYLGVKNDSQLLIFLENLLQSRYDKDGNYKYISTITHQEIGTYFVKITYQLENKFGFNKVYSQSFIFKDSKLIFE